MGAGEPTSAKLRVADFDGVCSGDIIVMEAKPDLLLPELLPFIVQTEGFYEHALSTSAGSLSPRTKWSALAQYEFPLPSLDEQRRIAEILWAVEDTVEQWLIGYGCIEKLIAAVRENVICDPTFERISLRSCLADIVAGKSVVGVNEPADTNEYGVLKVSAVGENGFECLENKRLIEFSDFIPQFQVGAGDLLITRANTTQLVGRACLVPLDYPNLMLSDKTLRTRRAR